MGAPAMKTVVAVKALPMPWARIAWAWGDTRASGCAAALRLGEQRGDQLLHVLPGRGVLGWLRLGQTKALRPVMARPTIRVFISRVPS
jgi:hypothetical protein